MLEREGVEFRTVQLMLDSEEADFACLDRLRPSNRGAKSDVASGSSISREGTIHNPQTNILGLWRGKLLLIGVQDYRSSNYRHNLERVTRVQAGKSQSAHNSTIGGTIRSTIGSTYISRSAAAGFGGKEWP